MQKLFSGLAFCLCVLAASTARAQTIHVLDTGDPAERICNPKSYTDLGNGIVRDNVTGLEWVQDGNLMATRNPEFDNDDTAGDGLVNWQHAFDYVALLNAEEYLGHGDWRLPTLHELSTILDFGRWGPAIDPVFSSVSAYYWSSLSDPVSAGNGWYLDFNSGTSWFCNPAFAVGYVRAVRGGPYVLSYDFVDNGDGTLSDTDTGLMWPLCNYGQTWDGTQCTGSRGSRTWDQALAYVQEINAAQYFGYDDWRLPTVNELLSLIDYSLYGPATTFPNRGYADMSSYWSSVTTSWLSDAAWGVNFNLGNVKAFTKETYNYVSAVRGGLCRVDGDWCIDDNDCTEGSVCIESTCDAQPSTGSGPYLAAGTWPVLPTSPESPMYLDADYEVVWKFSDDFASCSEDCTHAAEYQALGGSEWTALAVTATANGYAYVTLPIESLQNATTYAFRYSVTDCASQTTQSSTYYFRVATSDAPPVITGGPFVAAGAWPVLATSSLRATVLNQNEYVLWTFSDDYAFCNGLCTHRARYRKVGDTVWTWITASADPTGKKYAYAELPVESLDAGTYQFYFDVRDCAGQRTSAPKVYYFKVE